MPTDLSPIRSRAAKEARSQDAIVQLSLWRWVKKRIFSWPKGRAAATRYAPLSSGNTAQCRKTRRLTKITAPIAIHGVGVGVGVAVDVGVGVGVGLELCVKVAVSVMDPLMVIEAGLFAPE